MLGSSRHPPVTTNETCRCLTTLARAAARCATLKCTLSKIGWECSLQNLHLASDLSKKMGPLEYQMKTTRINKESMKQDSVFLRQG